MSELPSYILEAGLMRMEWIQEEKLKDSSDDDVSRIQEEMILPVAIIIVLGRGLLSSLKNSAGPYNFHPSLLKRGMHMSIQKMYK